MADMGGRMVCLNSVIPMIPATGFKFMNIARNEQRVLHVLAQGGLIRHHRDEQGRIILVECFTRDGHLLSDCTLDVFSRLRRKRLIESRESGPYRISRRGRESVRSQADNR